MTPTTIDIDLCEETQDIASPQMESPQPPDNYKSIFLSLQVLVEAKRRGIEGLDYAIETLTKQLWKEVK